ncbi:MAG: hypothetical protein MUC50_15155, partial [Myxococcota bacterium]|nr:hypothetical protein [Myxococcota bacterium]
MLIMSQGACPDNRYRAEPPTIYFAPSSILAGESAVLRIDAPSFDFRDCDGLGPASLTFKAVDKSADKATSSLQTLRLDLEPSGIVRAALYASPEVAPGDHTAVLACNSKTRLHGVLRVRSRSEPASLTIEPSSVAAGSRDVQLELTVDGASFAPGKSHVLFGTGDEIEVTSTWFSSGPPVSTMWVRVNVSEDLAATTADAPMEVAVITESEVVRGSLSITNSQASWLFVSPSTIDRPASELSAPLQYTLRVQSQNMEFEAPDTDPSTDTETSSATDTDADSGTTVAFRGNPGLKVASVEVIRSDVLEATVLVYPEAFTR